MTEIIIACSYTYGAALEMDCEEEPTWRIVFWKADLSRLRELISCDHHLADLARTKGAIFEARITLEPLP